MANRLREILETKSCDSNRIETHTGTIHRELLGHSPYLDVPNFTRIHPSDLERMFQWYDKLFFEEAISKALGDIPLTFDFSSRMTSAAGKTTEFRPRSHTGELRYEIKISSQLLFHCFGGNDHRPIPIAGRICRDRLDALQRIMEHEVVHLAEMLAWFAASSNCGAGRFQSIARRFFGHESHQHKLISTKERASVQFGIRPGVKVRFEMDGQRYVGLVNRVNKRATVLVEDPQGVPYQNGKRYRKFYVPIPMLENLDADGAEAK